MAELLFTLAGKLDSSYDVWLDNAPRRSKAPEGPVWHLKSTPIYEGDET